MPNTANPQIDEWVQALNNRVEKLNDETYFIGHSIGCQTIMRYLETKEKTRIGGILFVAPWLDLLPEAVADEYSYNTAMPWINTPINFEKIKQFTNNINCIFSDDDYFVSLKQEDEFKNKLNAKTLIVKNKGHISKADNVYELQEILDLSSNFEQIIKAPHYALPSYVVFYHNLYGSTHFCGSHFLSLLYRHFCILSNVNFYAK